MNVFDIYAVNKTLGYSDYHLSDNSANSTCRLWTLTKCFNDSGEYVGYDATLRRAETEAHDFGDVISLPNALGRAMLDAVNDYEKELRT